MHADATDPEDDELFDEPATPAGSTLFDLEHKVFHMSGARFAYGDEGRTPCFFVSLGGVMASIPVSRVCYEFKIVHGTRDFELTGIIAKALEYVREIRPGDAIPSELLDGSASWSIAPRHAHIARQRVYGAVAQWAAGETDDNASAMALSQSLETDTTPLEAAPGVFEVLASAIGLGADILEANERVARIAHEWSYIEGLRDHYGGLFKLPSVLDRFRRLAAKDRNRREEYDRMTALIALPIKTARQEFQRTDHLLAKIAGQVRDHEQTVQKIRLSRDRLHVESLVWSPVVDKWRDDEGFVDDDQRRIATYRYLASNFAQGGRWKPVFRQR